MKEIFLQTPAVIEETGRRITNNHKRRRQRWTFALYLSVIAGIISAFSGLALGALSYIGLFRNAEFANEIGNLLIIAAFPLMMLGAHALDKINELRMGKKRL
jgi:high-affinity Fe2+/Pb2+ permease